MLRRLKRLGADVSDLKEIYIKQVRSILEYVAPVWNPNLTKKWSIEIEQVQKSLMHIVLGTQYESDSKAFLTFDLDTLSLQKTP